MHFRFFEQMPEGWDTLLILKFSAKTFRVSHAGTVMPFLHGLKGGYVLWLARNNLFDVIAASLHICRT